MSAKLDHKQCFKEEYLSQLEELESFVKMNLNSPSLRNYYIHLSKSDEVLEFDAMLDFLEKQNIEYIKKEYDSDHRFRNIKEVMEYVIKH